MTDGSNVPQISEMLIDYLILVSCMKMDKVVYLPTSLKQWSTMRRQLIAANHILQLCTHWAIIIVAR